MGSSTSTASAIHSNKVETIKVVFFNPNALPPGEGDTPTGPFLGVGPKVIRLVE